MEIPPEKMFWPISFANEVVETVYDMCPRISLAVVLVIN